MSFPAGARTLQAVLNHGTLRVGVALYAPWALRGQDGNLRGFEIDVAEKLAADMGVKPQIVAYDSKRLIPALQSGEIDIIAAGMTITPERALQVNFSQPYESGGIALAANLSSTNKAHALEDLNSDQFRFAAVKDSVAEQLARRVFPNAKLVTFKTGEAAAGALVAGKVDGYLEEQPAPMFLALEHPGKIDVPLARPLLETRSAFAVGKGDPDFLAFLDAWITAHEADTWLPSTYHYWFETLSWRNAGEAHGKG
ncbi:MAG TPA: transporter substrate-binding domain-containing protein [Gammaproteobacteria bacterium]|nr:transporter substrate-binding domain-containing protein [Gammaproteobacteria bacterium]